MRFLPLPCLAICLFNCGCTDRTTSMPLEHLAFSPDGKWLAACGGTFKPRGGDGIVKVWETATWKLHNAWTDGFTDHVDAVFFWSNDTISTLSIKGMRDKPNSDGTIVRRWNVAEKKELEPILLDGYYTWGRDLGYFSPNNLIAFNHFSPAISGIYSFPNLEEKILLKDCPPAMLRFSPDGKRILAGFDRDAATEIRLYDTANGLKVAEKKLDAPKNRKVNMRLRAAEFSPDGKKIAVRIMDPHEVHIFSADLSESLLTLETPGVSAECVKFTPDSGMIAVNKDRDVVHLISLKTKESTKKFAGNPADSVGWCFSPDGNWIAIVSGGKNAPPSKIRVYDVKTGKVVAELE